MLPYWRFQGIDYEVEKRSTRLYLTATEGQVSYRELRISRPTCMMLSLLDSDETRAQKAESLLGA